MTSQSDLGAATTIVYSDIRQALRDVLGNLTRDFGLEHSAEIFNQMVPAVVDTLNEAGCPRALILELFCNALDVPQVDDDETLH